MIATVLFGLCFILADVVVGYDVTICNHEFQCITCHHCHHLSCPSRTKLTCYTIVKRGGGGDNGNHGDSNCACQPEDYCDGFYTCNDWHCPDPGFIPQCNRWNHTCICVQRTGTCSGNDVSTCKITCNSQEKLYCDHGFCSCKSLDYCNQNNADCAIHTCSDLAEAPFCNVTQCQCASVVDTCNGPFMHQICSNGVCQCQLNPSCSSAAECTETNTAIDIGTNTLIECKLQYGLSTDCENGRCQCFRALSTSSTTMTAPTTKSTVPTTTASTTRNTTQQISTSTIPQQQTSCSSAAECTETNTAIDFGTNTVVECKSQYGLYTDCENGRCQCFRALSTSSTTRTAPTTTSTVPTTTASTTRSTTQQPSTTSAITQQQTSSATTDPSTPAKVQTTAQPISNASVNPNASATTDPSTPAKVQTTAQPISNASVNPNAAATCTSRMDCNQQNTHITFLTFTMPCPVDHIDCVHNKCFCGIDKITSTPKPTTTTNAAPSISCHQCGDPDANLPCDLRTVYMGQPSQCSTGSYCMTDVVQGSDGSIAIYKRCVDELTCRNEWMAQSSDQDRCLRYAENAVPGQYTCHYCCTVDGCNSNIVPDAKTFYSTSSSINN